MTECRDFSDEDSYIYDDHNPFDKHTYSNHPVDNSPSLFPLLGRSDEHDEELFKYYEGRIQKITSGTNKGRDESR